VTFFTAPFTAKAPLKPLGAARSNVTGGRVRSSSDSAITMGGPSGAPGALDGDVRSESAWPPRVMRIARGVKCPFACAMSSVEIRSMTTSPVSSPPSAVAATSFEGSASASVTRSLPSGPRSKRSSAMRPVTTGAFCFVTTTFSSFT